MELESTNNINREVVKIMRMSLKVLSITIIVLCGLALINILGETTTEDFGYTFVGLLLFGGQAIITLMYISETDKKLDNKKTPILDKE